MRLVHVIDELSFALTMDAYAGSAGNWLQELRTDAAALLQAGQAKAAEANVQADTVLLDRIKGTVHDQIIAEVESSKAELVVIGTHGRRGIGRWVMGSSAEHVLRMSPVPVLLVRAPESASTEHARFTLPVGVLASA